MNRFENVILTNMCMVYNDNMILVQDRVSKDWPGVTFPGGHIKKKESFFESVKREIREETGLNVNNLKLCGVKQFTSIDNEYRYIVFLFKTNSFSGEIISSREGNVFWIDRKDLFKYKLADGFEDMYESFFSKEFTEVYFEYDGNWNCKYIGG